MEIFLFCKKKIGKSAKITQEHRASSLFRHSPTRLCSKCKTVSSFSRPVPAIFSANSPPAAHTRISVKRLIVCHSATWFFLTTRPMPATRLKGPNGLLTEPLREARPGPFALSLQLFRHASVASRMVGRPFSPCRPRFLGLFGPPLHARWRVFATGVLSKNHHACL